MAPVKMLWGPAAIGQANIVNSALSSLALNDSDNAAGWSFCVPKDGTIEAVGVLLTAENGTSPAYNCGVVTLDSSGRPTTTAYGGSAVTSAQWTSTGWKWITLSTGATANAGDYAAVHIYPGASAPDGSNNISVCRDSVAGPGVTLYYGVSWLGTQIFGGAYAIRYSDGTVFGNALTSNTPYVQLRSDATPDEAGCKFTVPAAMTVTGARVGIAAAWGSSATATVTLYDNSNTSLASVSISDKDYVDDNTIVDVYFDAVNLTAGATYRLTVTAGASGTGGNVYLQRYPFDSTNAKAAWPCGADWQFTERTDAGAWTDVSTDLSYFGLWVSDIDFSGGTVTTIFEGGPLSAEFPASNFPAITPVNGRVALAFDASTDEACYWSFICPQGGVGTTLTCIVYYAMASATSGAVYWQAALEAVTPGDSLDLDATTSIDTANSGNGTVPGTAGYMQSISITMTNKDSIAAGDLVWLKLNRDADNGSDTATGDAYVYRVELRSA